jgi:hypothetical protein
LAASIAVKLVAAGAQHLAADRIGARGDFQEGVSDILVVLDREALEKCIAVGAESRGECRSHKFITA